MSFNFGKWINKINILCDGLPLHVWVCIRTATSQGGYLYTTPRNTANARLTANISSSAIRPNTAPIFSRGMVCTLSTKKRGHTPFFVQLVVRVGGISFHIILFQPVALDSESFLHYGHYASRLPVCLCHHLRKADHPDKWMRKHLPCLIRKQTENHFVYQIPPAWGLQAHKKYSRHMNMASRLLAWFKHHLPNNDFFIFKNYKRTCFTHHHVSVSVEFIILSHQQQRWHPQSFQGLSK